MMLLLLSHFRITAKTQILQITAHYHDKSRCYDINNNMTGALLYTYKTNKEDQIYAQVKITNNS